MLLLQLIIVLLFGTVVSAQSPDGSAVARLRISVNAHSELRFQLNGSDVPTRELNGQFDGLGLVFKDDILNVRTTRQPVLIESEAGAWEMEMGPENEAAINASLSEKRIGFKSGRDNRSSLHLMFSDKASAEMGQGATAELDFFLDRTYRFSGSTNVIATTADGQKFKLSPHEQPMLGGELKQVTDARGVTRFQRGTPAIQVGLRGNLAGAVQVQAPGNDINLIPDQEKHLGFPNGSTLVLKYISARQLIEWSVVKGVFQFKIDGFNCWKATVLSGQPGVLQWNPVRKIIDFGNRGASPATVALNGRVHASVGPGATFQYAQFQDCGSFTTAASGGEVFLVDRETSEVTPVLSTITFSDGVAGGSSEGDSSAPMHILKLAWPSETRVEFKDENRVLGLSPGQENHLGAGAEQLDVVFTRSGEVTLRASRGGFEVRPGFLPAVALEIPEGGSVVLTLERRRNVFAARAGDDSAAASRVIASGKTYMFLSGSARLSVMVGQNSFIPETAASWIFFEGAGGESTFSSGPQPAPVIRPDRFDASRIFQQPVSVIE